MAARQFSNIAVETTLSSGIAGGASSLTVVSATGWPAAPFILVIEPGLGNEELILVGAKAGAVFSSLTRGFGGTSDVGHSAGDVIKHVIVGEDLALTYTHVHKPGTDDTAAVTHADILASGVDDHHNEAHTVVSHSDTLATGAELDTLTDGSLADALHDHDHGSISGLSGDDHTQYLTDARHNTAHGTLRAERITSTQSLPDNTETTVIYNTVVDEDDPDGDITFSIGTGIATINNPGWYLITAGVRFIPPGLDDSIERAVSIQFNGTNELARQITLNNGIRGQIQSLAVTTIFKMASTDTLRVKALQNNLTNVAETISPSKRTFFAITKLRE